MRQQKHEHWGDWIKGRMLHVGFRRQLDLASEIGCREQTLSRLLAACAPPRNMRMGFDQKMAIALKINRQILFSGWEHYSPTFEFEPSFSAEPLRRQVMAIVELLEPDQLRKLHDEGRQMLANTSAGD